MPVEQQTQSTSSWAINYHNDGRGGQRLTISNREVTKLAFWIRKRGSPTGNFTICIRRESDDGILLSKVWGLANDLPTVADWVEVTFDTPAVINEEVRLSAEADVQPYGDDVFYYFQNTDVKPSEVHSRYLAGAWADQGSEDCAYRYTYEAPPGPTVNITNTEANPTSVAEGGGGRRTLTETETNPMIIPAVTTNPATGIATSATLNGTLDDDGGVACDCGFEWGETEAYGNTTPTQSRRKDQAFAQTITGLASGMAYHFRAFASSSAGTSYGADRTFTTLAVTTRPATSIESTLATLNGTLDADGNEACACSFEYGETTDYGSTTATQSKTTGETFSQEVRGLKGGTVYHFRAKATNSAGTSCGADRTFHTEALSAEAHQALGKGYALGRHGL